MQKDKKAGKHENLTIALPIKCSFKPNFILCARWLLGH